MLQVGVLVAAEYRGQFAECSLLGSVQRDTKFVAQSQRCLCGQSLLEGVRFRFQRYLLVRLKVMQHEIEPSYLPKVLWQITHRLAQRGVKFLIARLCFLEKRARMRAMLTHASRIQNSSESISEGAALGMPFSLPMICIDLATISAFVSRGAGTALRRASIHLPRLRCRG